MKDEIREYFGIEMDEDVLDRIDRIPYYMSSGRHFYQMRCCGVSFLLVTIPSGDRFGVTALEKQAVRYSEVTGLNVAYSFEKLTAVQRNALVRHQVPFLCLPDHLYLPFLALVLNNAFKAEKIIDQSRLTPAAQLLFLLFLYRAKSEEITKSEASEQLHLTKTSITRASGQLAVLHLITQKNCGTEVRMKAAAEGRAYLTMADSYLINPVRRTLTVRYTGVLDGYPAAGESALSLRSMLNDPFIPQIAVSYKDPVLKNLREADPVWDSADDFRTIQVWKYDPFLFSENQIVDPVSMMLSLREEPDERVQGQLEEFMEGAL